MLRAVLLLLIAGMIIFFTAELAPEVLRLGSEITDAHCRGKWKDSGLASRFTFGTGCMVQVDGRWIPEANVQIRPRISN
jgi:hypothetical protein